MLINKKLLEQLISLASDSAEYLNEKWITVKPHGDDSKGVHVKVEDGETSKQAVERKFGDGDKKQKDLNDIFDMTTSETNKEMKGQWHINDFARKHNIKVEDVKHFRDIDGTWITAKLKNARKGYKEYAMLSK